MNIPPDQLAEHLAQGIARVLQQPPPRAPASLQQRVLAQIGARAARPWWRHRVALWPLAARAAFLAGGSVLAGWLLLSPRAPGSQSLSEQLAAALSPHLPRTPAALNTAAALGRAGAALLASVPEPWLQGGLVFTTALYAALFALLSVACLLLGRPAIPPRQ